jgi:hypothetical protein
MASGLYNNSFIKYDSTAINVLKHNTIYTVEETVDKTSGGDRRGDRRGDFSLLHI